MGTRGVSGAGRFFLGSNSISVIQKVGVPVFIIPPGAKFKPIRRIGLATDLRDVVDNTPVGSIRELVNFFNADLHVLNVDFERRHFTPYTPEESLKLETLLTGLNPIYDFIESKDVDESIIEFAERKDFDLIISFPKTQFFGEGIRIKYNKGTDSPYSYPFNVCASGQGDGKRLELGALGRSGEGNHIANVGHSGNKQNHSFKTKSESRMRNGTKLSGIQIPPEFLL